MSLIELKNLKTAFETENGTVTAVNGVDLLVKEGTRHGIIGRSGAGKSILALSILRLLPENARISGNIYFKGEELCSCSQKRMAVVRGRKIMMIFQNPATTLNPVFTIERQLCEMPIFHDGVTISEARRRATETLFRCGLPQPEKIMRAYPFELSGGMLQRVAIAMGIICRPDLLIADEPFKGLDIRLQKQVAATLDKVCRELAITLLIITHTLKIAHALCDEVSVMHGGGIFETAPCERFFSAPRCAYSQEMVGAYFLFSAGMENGVKREERAC